MGNRDSNLRIKTSRGNRSTDRKNDSQLVKQVRNRAITKKAVANRAIQAYKGAQGSSSRRVNRAAQKIGDTPVKLGKVGRPPTVRSLAKSTGTGKAKGKRK